MRTVYAVVRMQNEVGGPPLPAVMFKDLWEQRFCNLFYSKGAAKRFIESVDKYKEYMIWPIDLCENDEDTDKAIQEGMK